ncbi:MAG: hypothetical protein ACPGQL_06475 [Thermoplasmatota archaeon]
MKFLALASSFLLLFSLGIGLPAAAEPQTTCLDPLGATYCATADVSDPVITCQSDGDAWACDATATFTLGGSGPIPGTAEVTEGYILINACTGFNCQETRVFFAAECSWLTEGGCSTDVTAAVSADGFRNGRCMEFFAEVIVPHTVGPIAGVPLVGMQQGADTETISLGC